MSAARIERQIAHRAEICLISRRAYVRDRVGCAVLKPLVKIRYVLLIQLAVNIHIEGTPAVKRYLLFSVKHSVNIKVKGFGCKVRADGYIFCHRSFKQIVARRRTGIIKVGFRLNVGNFVG